jgi:hypothetical protein
MRRVCPPFSSETWEGKVALPKPRCALSMYLAEGPERLALRMQCHGAPPRTSGSALAHHLGSTTCATPAGVRRQLVQAPPIGYPILPGGTESEIERQAIL